MTLYSSEDRQKLHLPTKLSSYRSFQNMAYLNSVDLCTCVVNSVLDIWSRQLLKKRTSAWCLFLNFHRARIHVCSDIPGYL
ncbi:Nucleobase transporter PlUacP [Trichinella spiralis]|uniref:Nucleobase transporter PlUacP n=1 Tax=Trichinella spiralis TaxID=6334 RepID=A0ABR3KE91_TRISP